MDQQTPFDAAQVKAAARLCRLPLADERAAALASEMDGIFALLGALAPDALGDVAPATAYRAKWEG